jgi:glycosyl hydrolase family 16/carboxypeptidase family protein
MRKSPALRHCTHKRHALCPVTVSLVFAVLLLGGCCSWRDIHPPAGSISGRVVDPQDHAVAGVEVRLGDRRVAVTDGNGKFTIRAVPSDDRLALSFSAPKFMSTTRIYDAAAASRGNTIVIWPRATPARLRASEGGKLKFSGGTIVFPPNAFVDTKGRQVKGDVNVSMSVLDIADPRQLASAPGDFTARMRDGSIQNLETFGLFELVVADGRGRAVDFARDRTARVELNVPEGRREVPQSIGSFSFDEPSGLWIEQSSFQVLPSTLVIQVASWGWWNADVPIENTCVQVQVLGCHTCLAVSGPIQNASVTATGRSYTGVVTQDLTDPNGIACLAAKIGSLIELKVSDGGRDHTLRDIATSSSMLDVANCSTCPLVTVTHAVAAPIVADPLTGPSSLWCATEKSWNGAPFSVAWQDDQGPQGHVDFSPSGLILRMDNEDATNAPCDSNTNNCSYQKYSGGQYHTTCFHGYGVYTATITPPSQPFSGVVTGFFTYTDGTDGTAWENGANPWDEIDIELLGRAPITTGPNPDSSAFGSCAGTPLIVQTNYFVKGVGANQNEKSFCLAYGTYTYSFTWTDTKITWSYKDVSGNWHDLRTESRGLGDDWPTQPGRVFMNIWASTSGAQWIGPFNYTLTGPKSAVFTNVSVP